MMSAMSTMPVSLPATRWSAAYPIRRREGFEIYAARRRSDGSDCTVVVPGPLAEPVAAERALKELARAHELVSHPMVPRTCEQGDIGGRWFVELDCPAVTDAIEVIRFLPTAPSKIPYPAADAFIYRLREAAQAAHAVAHPGTGRPYCLGRVSPANVLFDAQGRWYLFGFGHNVAVMRESGRVDATVPFFNAPEISAGADPSPTADYVALLLFARSVAQYIDLTGVIGNVVRGLVSAGSKELAELVHWVESRVIGEIPSRRASVSEAVSVADRIRRIAGITIDPEGFARYSAALLSDNGLPPGETEATGGVLYLGPEATWVLLPDGTRHKLGAAHRRLLLAFVEHHALNPTTPLRAWELFEAGWPGEQASYEAALNRVYVTLSRLRERGLRDAIERFDDGWRLAPGMSVRFVDR